MISLQKSLRHKEGGRVRSIWPSIKLLLKTQSAETFKFFFYDFLLCFDWSPYTLTPLPDHLPDCHIISPAWCQSITVTLKLPEKKTGNWKYASRSDTVLDMIDSDLFNFYESLKQFYERCNAFKEQIHDLSHEYVFTLISNFFFSGVISFLPGFHGNHKPLKH